MGVDKHEMKDNMEEKEKLISLKYEHLPDFCYNCGILSHKEKSCPIRTGRQGHKNFGPWLQATILRSSSSEEKSRSSNDRRGFWLTNNAGSNGSKQGSDAPSWKRNSSPDRDNDRSRKGEENEVASPLITVQESKTQPAEVRRPSLEDNTQVSETKWNKAEDDFEPRNRNTSETVLLLIAKETANKIFLPAEEVNEDKERPHVKVDGQKKEIKDPKKVNNAKQGTFKRIPRAKNNHQQDQSFEFELKKRSAMLMEVDTEAKPSKRTRMEVDGENNGDGEKEENNNSKIVNAGLQGQPDEPK
ncbi:hypothetical protein CFC21_043628 [Triticum aestivum]|uniref:CCHC-type domain-containing protein n=2 Tax=Triticum aestivum TaxID=4565 RepID=A0A3B6FYP1_WHEAT|nr:hypothetical protein CFC21_043628 [Triticum aestivum]